MKFSMTGQKRWPFNTGFGGSGLIREVASLERDNTF